MSVRIAVVLVLILALMGIAVSLVDLPAPLSIVLDGRPVLVPAPSHVGEALRRFDVAPIPGRLLDLEGHVLLQQADPGRVLLNGAATSPRAPLASGDVLTIVDGEDRTEGTRRIRTRLPGRRYGDPQFSLGTARIVRVDTVGRTSGIAVSTVFRPVSGVRRPSKVALTFDDGPWPGSTRRILRVLHRMHVKATFFVVGYLARRYPAMIRAEIRSGMTVGSHSWSHPNVEPFKRLREARLGHEMGQTNDFLQRTFGLRVHLFRPPGGSWNDAVVTEADALGMRVVNWNVDARDWAPGASATTIARRVVSEVEPGSIVALHDGGGDRLATLRALPTIIRKIRKMGLTLVAIH
jgi:peptidoglycan/xylan/chitin deacetylase (PgdA/CDA1 family)